MNLTNRTIEEVIAKMQSSALGLIELMRDDFEHHGAPKGAMAALEDLYDLIDSQEADWYNKSENYQDTVREALEAKKRVISMLTQEENWLEDMQYEKEHGGAGFASPMIGGVGKSRSRWQRVLSVRSYTESRTRWVRYQRLVGSGARRRVYCLDMPIP